MARASNVVIGIFNTITILLSLSMISASFYFRAYGGMGCQKVLQNPLLYTGLGLFVVSLIGLMGSCCKGRWAMCLYNLVLFLLMLSLIAFTAVFLLMVMNKGVGNRLLGDYSYWLEKNVVNGKNWDEIRSCLIDSHVCRNIGEAAGRQADLKAFDFYKLNLSPTQSGCCKPPVHCGFQYKNATFWEVPKSGPAVPDSDCRTWTNDQTKLCYDCKSCKGGVVANIRQEWKNIVILNGCLFLVISIFFSIGCCAYENNKSDTKYTSIRLSLP